MKHVLITVPNTGWVHKRVTMSLLALQMDRRYKVTIMLPTWVPYEHNQHRIVQDFIKGEFDFWLSFDSDNPPINNPLDLVDFNRDIIGLPTPVWHFKGDEKPGEQPIYWTGYDYVPEKDAYRPHDPKKGLQRVDAIGTGCFLIARRVFMNAEMRKAPFLRCYTEAGIMEKGNDIMFSERARKQGFELWCHYDYPCMHFNELELNEVVRAVKNLYKDGIDE